MEMEKYADDGYQSAEIESALKRFEDVCNSLEDQQNKLLCLEKRRAKLNEDLQALRDEIEKENEYFRSVIDEDIDEELKELEYSNAVVEPATLDTGAVKDFINTQRKELAVQQQQQLDFDLMKRNLEMHESKKDAADESCMDCVGDNYYN